MAIGSGYKICGGNAGTGASTLVVTATTSTTAGDTIAVWVTSNGTNNITSVTDTQSNSYSQAGTTASNGSLEGQWWVAALNTKKLTAASDTITLTLTGTGSSKSLTAYGCPGAAPSPVDQAPTPTSGTSVAPSITSAALSQPSEMCLAGLVNASTGGAVTWTGSFASPVASDSEHPGAAQFGQSAIVASASSAAVTGSGTIVSSAWAMGLVTLIPAVTPSPGKPAAKPLARPARKAQASSSPGGPVTAPAAGVAPIPFSVKPVTRAVPPRRKHQPHRSAGATITAPPGLGTPYFVGSGTQKPTVATSTLTFTITNSTTAGDAVVVGATCATSLSVLSVTDSKGNTYSGVAATIDSTLFGSQMFVALSTTAMAGGTDTVTVTFGASTTSAMNAGAVGCSGVAGVAAVDVAAAGVNSTGSTAPSAVTGATTQASEVAVGWESNRTAGGNITWAAGWVNQHGGIQTAANPVSSIATQVLFSTGSVTASGTITSTAWDMAVVVLKAAVAVTAATQAVRQPVQRRPARPRPVQPQSSPGTPFVAPIPSTPATFHPPTAPTGLTGPLAPRRRRGKTRSSAGAPLTLPGWTALLLTLRQAALPQIVQQVSGTAGPTHGMSSVEMTCAPGNALIVFAGWDLGSPSAAPMPWANVSDSAGNYWYHLGTSDNLSTGSRSAIWCCTNARAVQWVSCSLSAFASSFAYLVVEVSGMPSLTQLSVSVTGEKASASSLAFAATAGAADVAFSVLAAGSSSSAIATAPAGWAALNTVTAGGGKPDAVQIFPYWLPSVPAGSTVTASWTLTGGTVPVSGVLVSIESAPAAPLVNNPNAPTWKIEAGFGYLPGDPSAGPPSWTDITSRCIAKDGEPWVSWSYGRQYELAQPEAGTMTIGVNNADGAFTPGSNGPYGNVVLGTPIRVSAYWEGVWYHVAYGYVERWPQEWPDLPQWGLSKMVATDAWAVMNSGDMPSALIGDMLLDGPYALLAGGEQYFTATSGFTAAGNSPSRGILGTVTPAESQGLIAANATRLNQKPGYYVDGSAAALQTGQTLGLLGDNGTGFGTSSASGGQDRGPGMVYADPLMPSPAAPAGASLEFWFVISGSTETTLMSAWLPPSPYNLGNLEVRANVGGSNLLVILPDGTLETAIPFTRSASPQHLVLTFTPAPNLISNPVLTAVYLNGALAATFLIASQNALAWKAITAGCARYAWGGVAGAPFVGNYAEADIGLYAYPLPAARIADHYSLGATGNAGHTFIERVGDILSWGGLGLPRGGPVTFAGSTGNVFCGPAYDIGGSTAASAVATFQVGDMGQAIAMPSGTFTVLPRWWTFNLASGVTFGDGTGEIPYLPGQAFDYDNTYLYNVSTATRTDGPTQGISVTIKDAGSEDSYFTRSALQQQIQTTSDYDAYSTADLGLATYSQPSLRVRALTVDAASNPAAWTAVLQTRVADVATAVRRPVGGAAITEVVQVQRVSGQIGPGMGRWSYQISPYRPQNAILTLDTTGLNAAGNTTLGP